MSKITVIQIDRSTLPSDGQKVEWQTYDDFNKAEWKQGLFLAEDQLFCVGFSSVHSKWDLAFDVHRWRPILITIKRL